MPRRIAILPDAVADQIDAIIYSSDFPYRVDLKDDLKGQNPPQQLSPHASLTSATVAPASSAAVRSVVRGGVQARLQGGPKGQGHDDRAH